MAKARKEVKKRKAKERAMAQASARNSRLQRKRRNEQAAEFALTKHRKLRSVRDLVRARQEGSKDWTAAPATLRNVATLLSETPDSYVSAVCDLLLALDKHRSSMLRSSSRYQTAGGRSYTAAIRTIARMCSLFIRNLDDWNPNTKNRHKQFASLVRHLFAKYDVPQFMDEAWFLNQAWPTSTLNGKPVPGKQLQWWLDIAGGKNIRKSGQLPWPLTKRMAHNFLQAPNDFTINGAFRWAQIHALGGDERIVRAVMRTFLGQNLFQGDQHTFYTSVIRFFINNPMLDTEHYGPVLDYLRNQKFVTQRGAAGPPQPNLSMKDRQADALLKQVEAWHARLGQESKRRRYATKWEHHAGIGDWTYTEKKKDRSINYSIEQLLSASALKGEGRRLEHCVGSYTWSCSNGRVSIWSVRRNDPGGLYEPLGTVEIVNEHHRIVQFAAKRNRAPGPKAKFLVEKWAQEFGIEVSRWIRW
jgi:hypothetical protein